MNKERREAIAKARGMLEEAKAIFEQAAQEERDYFDNMPESFQNGDKGTAASDAADKLDEIVNSLDEDISAAEEAAE